MPINNTNNYQTTETNSNGLQSINYQITITQFVHPQSNYSLITNTPSTTQTSTNNTSHSKTMSSSIVNPTPNSKIYMAVSTNLFSENKMNHGPSTNHIYPIPFLSHKLMDISFQVVLTIPLIICLTSNNQSHSFNHLNNPNHPN